MRRFVFFAMGLGAACTTSVLPGDVNMGIYGLHAQPLSSGAECPLEEVAPDGGLSAFDFDVTLSFQSTSAQAYVTLSGCEPSKSNCVRPAEWNGQSVVSTAAAPRVYSACAACVTTVTETISLALLSRSQAEHAGLSCPGDALDGGVIIDLDAGIRGPGQTSDGFDSILACGELRTRLDATELDAGTCPDVCRRCVTRYALSGARK